MGTERTPTLEEVASLAGVSRATVSRVVRGADNVREETRTAVLLAVDEVGYVPNQAARSLVTRRTDTIALVVTEPEARVFAEPFFADMARGAAAGMAAHGRQMVLIMVSTPEDEQRVVRYLAGGHADGVVLLSLHREDPLPDLLRRRRVPVAMAGRPPAGLDLPFVDADNVGGARQATAHLLERGRRRVATIAGPQDMAVGRQRVQGWRRAHDDIGKVADEDLVVVRDFTDLGGADGMAELLERDPAVDGVFAASDLMARGAIRTLVAAGRDVPDDVSVVGFDDASWAASNVPPLTTVHQPVRAMARSLVDLVVAQIDDVPGVDQSVVVPTRLVVRESS